MWRSISGQLRKNKLHGNLEVCQVKGIEKKGATEEIIFIHEGLMKKWELGTETQNKSMEEKLKGAKGELLKKEMTIKVTNLEQGRLI